MKLGFLGTGKMATAIAKGLVGKQVWQAADQIGFDVSPEACAAFQQATGVRSANDVEAFGRAADILLLAVKPQMAAAAVSPLRASGAGKLIISIAAGLPLAKLCIWFGHDRIIRVMPNTPSMVGCGAAVYACGAGVETADRETAARIFGAVGIALEMPEAQLDAVTALSGSGPAYVFEMIRVLVEGAKALGMPEDAALQLTVQTVAGAAAMLTEGMGTPTDLRRAVTSPGGTTAAGLAVLDEADFPELMAKVLEAARDRSIELGRQG